MNDKNLYVRTLSEAEFQNMGDEWQTCLHSSDADPLFMSWPWLFSWWETWSQVLGLELSLIGVFDTNERLCGLGPFFIRDLVTPVGVRVRRLYLLGNAWRIAPTVRTEYCGLIAERSNQRAIRLAIQQHLTTKAWDEMILSDSSPEEVTAFESTFKVTETPVTQVPRNLDTGVCIPTDGKFEDWLASLGRNTRLKAYNRRKYLQGKGELSFLPNTHRSPEEFMSSLNAFHLLRWGKPAFEEEAIRFHLRLVDRLPAVGYSAKCSELIVDGYCESVLYDIIAGDFRYNLQSGFNENLDSKVSLGFLHFGFAIEKAFKDNRVVGYNMLAGEGKNHNYKKHYQGQEYKFSTVQLVRTPWLKWLYRQERFLTSKARQRINKILRL